MIDAECVDFVALYTQDLDRAKQFYGETLGLTRDERGTNPDYPEYDIGGTTLVVTDPTSFGRPFAPSPGGFAVRVRDVAAARESLEAKGVKFAGPTIDTGVCQMAPFADPDGNTLLLHHRYAPFPDGSMP
jgi:catechol 2,3-dioxygenase-like lactoylglutathione lyase family enzyme